MFTGAPYSNTAPSSGGMSGSSMPVGPPVTAGASTGIPSLVSLVGQGANSVADYSSLPIGWKPSTYMGKCGYAIQEGDFYSQYGGSCYPIQDISCMGPTERRVWSDVCHANFPLKPIPIRHPPLHPVSSLRDSLGWARTCLRVLYNGLPLVVGSVGVGMGLGWCTGRRKKGDDSSDELESSDEASGDSGSRKSS